MTKRILNVVSNVAHFDDPAHATGLWLSELTHAWDQFAAQGWNAAPCKPQGRKIPVRASVAQMALAG